MGIGSFIKSAIGGSALGPVLGTGGSVLSSAMQYSNAEQNRSFQRSMDSTKYQRTMADMKEAGLNPLLAGNLGAGATPSGSAMGTIENPVASAAQLVKTMAEVGKINEEKKVQANIAKSTKPTGRVGEMVDAGIAKIQHKVQPLSSAREATHKAASSKRRVKDVLSNTQPTFEQLVNDVVKQRKKGPIKNSIYIQKLVNQLPGEQRKAFWQTVGKRLRGNK